MLQKPGIHNKIYDPYYIYHLPGLKVGATNSLEYRVEEGQGFKKGEYEVLHTINNIFIASFEEMREQKQRGYTVEAQPYYKLFNNAKLMRTFTTDLTTGFYCKKRSELKALINGEVTLKTIYGELAFDTDDKIQWLLDNVKESFKHKTNNGIAPFYINNKLAFEFIKDIKGRVYVDATNKAVPPNETHKADACPYPEDVSFDAIRKWAHDKKLYGHKNSSLTGQTLKVQEEMGELSHAVLKSKPEEIKDAIGDILVVLTSLSEINGHSIEDAMAHAWAQIRTRDGESTKSGDFLKY